MRILAAEPPGAEKPPTLPPAARTLWQGIISATGFFAMAWPTSRAASGPAPSSFARAAVGCRVPPSDPAHRGIDALKEGVLFAEVELEAGKICLLAFEIAPHNGDCFGHLWRGLAGFCPWEPVAAAFVRSLWRSLSATG